MTELSKSVFVPDEKYIWLQALDTDGKITITDEEWLSHQKGSDDQSAWSGRNEVGQRSEPLPSQNTDLPATGAADMVSLSYLHEASILHNLKQRFQCCIPYTYVGVITVAVNPYRRLDMYTPSLADEYKLSGRHELSPHIFSTSAGAYRAMLHYRRNQCILISGESGAGKTESAKILMAHLAHISTHTAVTFAMSNKGADKRDSGGNDGCDAGPDTSVTSVMTDSVGEPIDMSIIDKVLQANPLLEAFGNAKTLRNDNSSRFGKFTHMHFNDMNHLTGAQCVTYLLEKSRVFKQAPGERNYHIFHQLCAAPESYRERLFLQGMAARDFMFMNAGDVATSAIEGESDHDRFGATMKILSILDVSDADKEDLLRALSGMLYLGQIIYAGDDTESYIQSDTQTHSLTRMCTLLGLDESTFTLATTTRTIEDTETRQEVKISLTVSQANSTRESLAKEIYSRLFLWLVSVINRSTNHAHAKTTLSDASANEVSNATHTIALLDIFGFECFTFNSFEQLCINFANEKLQSKFTLDCFTAVQHEYQQEGLHWEYIDYVNNDCVIHLFEDKMGLIALLNEQCVRNMSNPVGQDLDYVSSIVKQWGGSPTGGLFATSGRGAEKEVILSRTPLMPKSDFQIKHYAGPVTYSAEGFVAKNKDSLAGEARVLMLASKNALLKQAFEPIEGEDLNAHAAISTKSLAVNGGGAARTQHRRRSSFMGAETILTKFRGQLNSLLESISNTDVQYIRCIKPNKEKSSTIFDRGTVVEQLRCAGMIEAIRISRVAYPYRLLHSEFIKRFGILAVPEKGRKQFSSEENQQKQCLSLLTSVVSAADANAKVGAAERNYEVGHTRVYFTNKMWVTLEAVRKENIHKCATRLQAILRGCTQKRLYQFTRTCVIRVQCLVRCIRAKRIENEMFILYWSRIYLQALMRRFLAARRYQRKRQAVLLLSALVRGHIIRKQLPIFRQRAAERLELRTQKGTLERLKQEVSRFQQERLQEQITAAERELTIENLRREILLLQQKQAVSAEMHAAAILEQSELHEHEVSLLRSEQQEQQDAPSNRHETTILEQSQHQEKLVETLLEQQQQYRQRILDSISYLQEHGVPQEIQQVVLEIAAGGTVVRLKGKLEVIPNRLSSLSGSTPPSSPVRAVAAPTAAKQLAGASASASPSLPSPLKVSPAGGSVLLLRSANSQATSDHTTNEFVTETASSSPSAVLLQPETYELSSPAGKKILNEYRSGNSTDQRTMHAWISSDYVVSSGTAVPKAAKSLSCPVTPELEIPGEGKSGKLPESLIATVKKGKKDLHRESIRRSSISDASTPAGDTMSDADNSISDISFDEQSDVEMESKKHGRGMGFANSSDEMESDKYPSSTSSTVINFPAHKDPSAIAARNAKLAVQRKKMADEHRKRAGAAAGKAKVGKGESALYDSGSDSQIVKVSAGGSKSKSKSKSKREIREKTTVKKKKKTRTIGTMRARTVQEEGGIEGGREKEWAPAKDSASGPGAVSVEKAFGWW